MAVAQAHAGSTSTWCRTPGSSTLSGNAAFNGVPVAIAPA
jgi:hypothetical protein